MISWPSSTPSSEVASQNKALLPMEPVRLTVLASSLTVGGAEQLLLELLRNLSPERFQTNIVFLRDPGPLGKEVRALGYPVDSGLLHSTIDLLGFPRLVRSFRRRRTDVLLLINHRNALFFGVPAAKLAGVKVIVNWENETYKRYSHHALTMFGRRFVHLGVDRIVAAANGHKDYIARIEGLPRRKISVIYNGVNPDRFRSGLSSKEAKRRLGIDADAPVVSIVAALRPDKAHAVFLRAARMILDRLPDTHFLVVGDGPERHKLAQISRELQVEPRVHFLGIQRQLGDILAAVDVNTLSSNPEQETLSVAAIEAMSAGVPIVCTDVGFMREIVLPGVTGALTRVGDAADLAAKVLSLLVDESERSRLGRNASARVEKRLTSRVMTRAFETLFLDSLAHKTA